MNSPQNDSPWQFHSDIFANGNITKIKISQDNLILTFPSFFSLLEKSKPFQSFYNEILAASSYPGFFWEIKPMNQNWENELFEFVLINSIALSNISANPFPFQKYFKSSLEINTFPNLGGDAQLIVPSPISNKDNYPHLATFVRRAPESQKNKLWQMTSIEYQKKLNSTPQWLSTSGLGVHWLHLRIDTRPKYYHFQPYKIFPSMDA